MAGDGKNSGEMTHRRHLRASRRSARSRASLQNPWSHSATPDGPGRKHLSEESSQNDKWSDWPLGTRHHHVGALSSMTTVHCKMPLRSRRLRVRKARKQLQRKLRLKSTWAPTKQRKTASARSNSHHNSFTNPARGTYCFPVPANEELQPEKKHHSPQGKIIVRPLRTGKGSLFSEHWATKQCRKKIGSRPQFRNWEHRPKCPSGFQVSSGPTLFSRSANVIIKPEKMGQEGGD